MGAGRQRTRLGHRGQLQRSPPGHDDDPEQRRLQGGLRAVLKQGCYDWIFYSDPIDAAFCVDQEADVGLIFPKEWCVKNGIEPYRRDSIVNKTILASRDPPDHGQQRALRTTCGDCRRK